ncbi:MAG: Copper-exporting P-type ATPase [Planctomycetota bacterium]|jgi:Cu2+-exporting ATPase
MTAGGAEVFLDPGLRRVVIRDRQLRTKTGGALFLARAFACQEVTLASCNVVAGTVTLQLQANGRGFVSTVAEVARAVRSAPLVRLPADTAGSSRFTIRRIGRRLTTWRVGSDAPNQLRFRHPWLARDRILARSLERLVVTLAGVHDARLTGWWSDLSVRIDPVTCDPDALLGLLQQCVDERALAGPKRTSPWQMAGKTAVLGVLAMTDLAFPSLAPVSGLLLVGGNLKTLRSAAGDLRRIRISPAVVATAIIVGTLATGQFLAAGIMAWSYDFWRRRHRRDVEAERLLLLEDAVPLPPRLLQVDSSHGVTSFFAAPGQRVGFRPWAVLPADGVVVAGGGVIDDRCLTGEPGGRYVTKGDRLPAGAVVLGGSGEMAVDGPPQASRAAGIARLVAAATEFQPGRFAPTIDADRLVTQFAGPTLATAGIGLLAGDVTTAVAVLRPDYGSAEAMSLSFEDLDAVACGLGVGCLIAAPRAVDRLYAIDTLLVLDHPGLYTRELEATERSLVPCDPASATKLLGLAASLARHVAGPRSEALVRLASDRGCTLLDLLPDSYGDERGLRIEARHGGCRLVLTEGAPAGAATAGLTIEVDGVLRASYGFAYGNRLAATGGLERIRSGRRVHLIVAAETADLPGAEQVASSQAEVRSRLRALRRAGRLVAVAGPPEAVDIFREEADLMVSLGLGDATGESLADIICLRGDLRSLAELLDAAADRQGRLATARRLSILPNAACVVGAFFFGFTSVAAALVSNLGTLGIYRRASGVLHRRRRLHWLRQRALLPRLAGTGGNGRLRRPAG